MYSCLGDIGFSGSVLATRPSSIDDLGQLARETDPADQMVALVLLDNPVLSHADITQKLGYCINFTVSISSDPSFPRFGKWFRTAADTIVKGPEHPAIQLLPGFAELLDIDDG